MGSVVTVSVLHPLIIFMIHTVGTLIYTLVFPLLFFSAVLHIASAISERFKVTQLANLLRNLRWTVLGVMLTMFPGCHFRTRGNERGDGWRHAANSKVCNRKFCARRWPDVLGCG